MELLRKTKTENNYQEALENGINRDLWKEPSIFETEDYRIVKNNFPYDAITDEHYMLLTKASLGQAVEWAYEYANKMGYDAIMINTAKRQSIPEILHIHLLK